MRTFVTVLAMMLFVPGIFYAQNEMILEDFATSGGKYLHDQIRGDTTATGARVNLNRIYVLRRGGTYLIHTQITNNGWTLRIKAENGAGPKPVIYTYKNPSTTSYPARQFDVRGDLWLSNLTMIAYQRLLDEDHPEVNLSPAPGNTITAQTVGNSIVVDSCIFIGARNACIQTSSATHKLVVTNSLFGEMGDIFDTNIGNGRPIDFRNVSVDSVIIQNNSFMDITDRVVRHYSSVGPIDYFLFDHNTVVNSASMHGCLGLGYVLHTVQITNNVFVDNFALGNDSTDITRLSEFGEPGEKTPNGQGRMTFVGTIANDTTQYIVRKNFYSVTPALQTFYDSHSGSPTPGGIGNLVPLTWYINKRIADSTTAFVKETITLNKATRNLVLFATWYYNPDTTVGANRTKNNATYSRAVDFQRPVWQFYADTLNLTYQTSAAAYTGADAGLPAGDLNWYPDKKLIWTSVDGEAGQLVPTSFSLDQNYPNPFNPSTKIRFALPHTGIVTLKVFNILGQEVATVINGYMVAGTHEQVFDAGKLSSGVYVYTLSLEGFFASKKMLLLK